MEKTKEKIKMDVKKELGKINSVTIYDFKKTIEKFDINKIKVYIAKHEEKTICIIFYENEFIAINRVNLKDGQEYSKDTFGISENLNYKIRKIPNVAKTRKVLNIEDIETRIYDISEYIVLLKKEEMKLIKVDSQGNLQQMQYNEYKLDINIVQENIKKYEEIEILKRQEENKANNKIKKFSEFIKHNLIEPLKMLKIKLMKSKEIKMLSDGKHSIFDKK